MNNPPWLQILIMIVVIAGPALGAMFRKLREQQVRRQQQIARERQMLESLRTGRPIGQESRGESASGEASELAKRRAQQLEELRRLQQARQAGTARQSPASPGQRNKPQAPQASSRAAEARQAAERRRAKAEAQRRAKEQQEAIARQAAEAERQRRAKVAQVTEPLAAHANEEGDGNVHRLVHDVESIARQQKPAGGTLGRMKAADWRRALILREVLTPPLSVRKPGGSPFDSIL